VYPGQQFRYEELGKIRIGRELSGPRRLIRIVDEDGYRGGMRDAAIRLSRMALGAPLAR
jgi:hypothetical protein